MNLLLVDNNKLVLEGLSMLISKHSSLNQLYTLTEISNIDSLIRLSDIDIALIDLNLGVGVEQGIELCRDLKSKFPHLKIIVLTGYIKVDLIKTLYDEIRVDGYASKDLGKEQLFEAIDSVWNGKRYLDPTGKILLDQGGLIKLTKRENEVLDLMSNGKVKREIAEIFKRSEHTIRRHIENAKSKFKARNSAHLIGLFNKYKSTTHEELHPKKDD